MCEAERSDERGREEGQPRHRSKDGAQFLFSSFWVCIRCAKERGRCGSPGDPGLIRDLILLSSEA